jgi:hypothetical protein
MRNPTTIFSTTDDCGRNLTLFAFSFVNLGGFQQRRRHTLNVIPGPEIKFVPISEQVQEKLQLSHYFIEES